MRWERQTSELATLPQWSSRLRSAQGRRLIQLQRQEPSGRNDIHAEAGSGGGSWRLRGISGRGVEGEASVVFGKQPVIGCGPAQHPCRVTGADKGEQKGAGLCPAELHSSGRQMGANINQVTK